MDGVSGKLTQTESGWSLAGIGADSSSQPEPNSSQASLDPLEIFLLGRDIQFNNITLQFDFLSGHQQKILLTGMSLQNDSEFHRITVNLDTPQRSDLLTFVFEGVGDPREVDTFSGRGYLKLDKFPLANTLAFVSESLTQRPEFDSGELSSELWLDVAAGAELSLSGSASLNSGPLSTHGSQEAAQGSESEAAREGEAIDLPHRLSGQFQGDWRRESGWQLSLQQLVASWTNPRAVVVRQTQPLDVAVTIASQIPAANRLGIGCSIDAAGL